MNYFGTATVETVGKRITAGLDGKLDYGMDNISTISRNLMNVDEILRLDNDKSIFILRGKLPVILDKYYYKLHPLSKNLKYTSIDDFLPEWSREFRTQDLINSSKKEAKKEIELPNQTVNFHDIEEV